MIFSFFLPFFVFLKCYFIILTVFHDCSYLKDELSGVVLVQSKHKATFWMKKIYSERRKINFFQSILEKHKSKDGDSLIFVQFSLKEIEYGWSGPICVSSLGRFFLKFRRTSAGLGTQSDSSAWKDNQKVQFAAVHIVEESSSLYLHFYRPPNFPLPYRIENCMSGTSIMYHQKVVIIAPSEENTK